MAADRNRFYAPNYFGEVEFVELFRESIRNGGLTPEQVAEVVAFRQLGNRQGFIHIQGLDVGDVPATPTSREQIKKADLRSEMLLLQATALVGDPIGYVQEWRGHIVNNFFPIPGFDQAPTSDSYDTELELHTENAFHPVQPDYLLLLCLRPDPAGEAVTYVSSIDDILPRLSDDEVAFFRSERYNFLSDYSAREKGHRIDLGNWLPVIYGEEYDPLIRLDLDFMVSASAQARAAVERLNRIAWEVASPIRLTTGDLLIIDNCKTAHARSAFRARHDGRDRWVQRTFSVNDARRHQAAMDGRRVVMLPQACSAADSQAQRPEDAA